MPIISDCTQVALHGTVVGSDRPWAIVQHCMADAGGPPSALEQAQVWVDAFDAELTPVISAGVTVESATYVDLRTSTGLSGPVTGTTLPSVGGGSGNMCPPNTAVLVKMSTAGGRSQRSGRMFLPGVDEDQVDAAGLMTTGYVNDVQNAIDDFWDALTTGGVIPVVSSKTGTSTQEPVTITAMAVQRLCATQRRRLRR